MESVKNVPCKANGAGVQQKPLSPIATARQSRGISIVPCYLYTYTAAPRVILSAEYDPTAPVGNLITTRHNLRNLKTRSRSDRSEINQVLAYGTRASLLECARTNVKGIEQKEREIRTRARLSLCLFALRRRPRCIEKSDHLIVSRESFLVSQGTTIFERDLPSRGIGGRPPPPPRPRKVKGME